MSIHAGPAFEIAGDAPATSPSASAIAAPPVEMQRLTGSDWDAAVADFDGVCQEQLHVFAQARWPGVACEPLLFIQQGRVVGAAMIMVQDLPLGLARIAVSKWGPFLADNSRPDAPSVYAAIIEALIAEYADHRGMMLSVLPRAPFADDLGAEEMLARRGFARGSRLLFPDRYVVNLRLDDAAQRKSFGQKWRYHLKKSEKEGLRFEHAPAERAGAFDALYQAMTDRKRFPDHSAYGTVPALMSTAVEALRPELFFVHHGDELVAGAIIFTAGDVAVYLYGATTDSALPLRAGYFLHWHIIRWLRDNTRARWYDLGGTDGFHGLHQFKKGMVGEAGRIAPVPPVMNYASHMRARLFGSLAFAAREGIARMRHLLERRPGLAKPDQQRPESEG